MLKELVQLSERLESRQDLIPLGYRDLSASVDWIFDISHEPPLIREGDLSDPRPNLKRTVAIRPLLCADYAYYVLGIPEEGKEARAQKAHQAFLTLLQEAADQSSSESFLKALTAIKEQKYTIPEALEPRDIVAIATGPGEPLYNTPAAREFWQDLVSTKFLSDAVGTCSVCGEERRLLQTLPEDVSILGETCQISSFNLSAFESYGLKQTLNASICYRCGARAAQALNHLVKSDDHRFRVGDDQLAVYWITLQDPHTDEGQRVELNVMLGAIASGDQREAEEEEAPLTLSQVEELLKVPWNVREESFLIGKGIYLMVISPNKARLVVREWIEVSPLELKRNLRKFLQVQRVEGPWGEQPRAFGLRQLLEPLEAQALDVERNRIAARAPVEANLIRALLRTAYKGEPAPAHLEAQAVRKLQNPKVWKMSWLTHRAVALLKLARDWREPIITNGKEGAMAEPKGTERLNRESASAAYRCGRLLAVLEDAQRQALGWDLNTTIVDRNFTAAATAPVTVLPRLVHLAETAHLPKIRRMENRTDRWIRKALEEILEAIDEFPAALDTRGQGDFILGFYHQRAEFQRRREEYAQE